MSEDEKDETAADVTRTFEAVSGGVRASTQNHLSRYTLRAMKGEPVSELTQGLPRIYAEEINRRLESIGKLKDEEETWGKLEERVKPPTSFDRKAFEYAWRVIKKGQDKEEVTQGLQEIAKERVDIYINATFNLATEKASSAARST